MSSQADMDDLINLINNISPSKEKRTPKTDVSDKFNSQIDIDTDSDTDTDNDVSYLFDVINKPNNKLSNINGKSSMPETEDTNVNNKMNSSLDDLIHLLSPHPTHTTRTTDSTVPKIIKKASIIPTTPTAVKIVPKTPPKSTISISIRTLTGDSIHLEMKPKDTIGLIKNKIFGKHKIWPQHQRLIYAGETLVNKHRLNMLGINDNAILYLVLHTLCSNAETPKKIAIQKLNGDIFYISCTSKDSVQTLKRTICNQEGYDIQSQILYFRYDKLDNEKTLESCNIQNNSMLKMMVKNTRFDMFDIEDETKSSGVEEEEESEVSKDEEEQIILKPFSPQNKDMSHPLIPIKAETETESDSKTKPDQSSAGAPDLPPALPPAMPTAMPPTMPTAMPPTMPTAMPPTMPTKVPPTMPTKVPPTVPPKVLPTVPPKLPPTVPIPPQRQGYNGFSIGDICYRKNEKCIIQNIDFQTNPPTLTVASVSDPKREINTEFQLLSKQPIMEPKMEPKIEPKIVPKTPVIPPPPPKSASHTNGNIRPHKPRKMIHLCSPSLITQLMSVNSIKYIGGGLRNLGNSCFMNATIQCLAYTQVFQNYIYQQIHSRICRRKQKQICFMCELHKVLPQIINNRNNTTNLYTLFNNLSHLSYSLIPGRQEDSHEFWTALVKHLQSSVIKPHILANNNKKLPISVQETSIIYKMFGGYLRSQILCTVCKKGSNTYDSIIDLSLEIRGCHSILSALRKFTVQERLIQDNKYFCQYCNVKQNAIKQLTIFDAPNILILHLKRFEFGTKIDKFVSFETTLDLTPFMSQYRRYKEREIKIRYTLYAVLIHSGKYSNCGHYYSYVRTANNKWYLCNDSSIKGSSVNTVLQQNGYMFFYQRSGRKSYR